MHHVAEIKFILLMVDIIQRCVPINLDHIIPTLQILEHLLDLSPSHMIADP